MAERISVGLKKSPAELRQFGLTVGAALAVVGLIAWLWRGNVFVGLGLIVAATLLGTFGMFAASSLAGVERAWMQMATAMSVVTTPVFMGVVYFAVITPIALTRRVLGKDSLIHSKTKGATHWRHAMSSTPMERQF